MSLPLTSQEITTPAFLVDQAIVVRNCATMREKAQRSGIAFRPHVKTHKTIEIAQMQVGNSSGPITVSTLAEAEFFARHGFDDITYAVPISPAKLQRAATLARQIKRLNLLLDSSETLKALQDFHTAQGVIFDMFLKVDSGYHRAGVDPDSPESAQLGVALANSSALRFHGLLTHAGHSYNSRNPAEIRNVAVQETESLTRLRAKIAEQGADKLIRSIGSTPTTSVVEKFTGTEEVRPGNYVFYDAFQVRIGACSLSQCAVSVLATVIGSYPRHGHLLIDGGALAFSKDPGPDHMDRECGFGVVCDLDLNPLPMNLMVLSQEHGKIQAEPTVLARYPVGTRLRIVPNHSCLTAAMYDSYHVVQNGGVGAQWRPVRGW
ncbi:MAG TPA: alanine racemase [Candidatus Angelobacter sp.]|jgi:D-serine deaminase-like pyridoxal phosphate-dependent protein|nr:alanine racemase [Candidatus Angelobacter sp.]